MSDVAILASKQSRQALFVAVARALRLQMIVFDNQASGLVITLWQMTFECGKSGYGSAISNQFSGELGGNCSRY